MLLAYKFCIINVEKFNSAKEIINAGGLINYNGASGKIKFNSKGDSQNTTYDI